LIRKITIIFMLVLFIFLFTIPAAAEPPAEPVTVGTAVLVMDAENGQVLYGKETEQQLYPASTTKIMTALLALEKSSLDEMVVVSHQASSVDGSRVGLQPGEKLPMEHLLYMLMLTSANDSAEAIAEHLGGSVDGFAKLMNQRARELGARNTNFTNPHGLPDAEHYTTARDLALIGREAMQNETFRRIAGTVNIKLDRKRYMTPEVLQSVEKLEQVHGPLQEDFYTHNRLLTGSYNGYKGANGIKTGYTVDAGQCIVASARRDGREMIAVVLNSQGANLWTDAAALLNYGFQAFAPVELMRPRQMITDAPVRNGTEEAVLETAGYFYYNFPVDEKPEITRRVELAEIIEAPLEAGERLGELVLEAQGRELGRVPLVTVSAVPRSTTSYPWVWLVGGITTFSFLRWLYVRRCRRRSRLAYPKRKY